MKCAARPHCDLDFGTRALLPKLGTRFLAKRLNEASQRCCVCSALIGNCFLLVFVSY